MPTHEESLVKSGNKDGAPVVPRDAASLIILRGAGDDTEVLMGKRPETARFMPGVYVYPGGAVDPDDRRMTELFGCTNSELGALAICAIRETWEEAGVLVGTPGALTQSSDSPDNSPGEEAQAFLDAASVAGLRPRPDLLRYVCHSITPEEVPIRFDVRFFLCDDSILTGEPHATGELPEVSWIRCSEALAARNISGITKRVLREALRLWGKPAELEAPDRKVAQIFYEVTGYRIIREERGGDMDEIWSPVSA